jgi:hypothetical protein
MLAARSFVAASANVFRLLEDAARNFVVVVKNGHFVKNVLGD